VVNYLGADLWGGPGTLVSNNTVDGDQQRGGIVLFLSVVRSDTGDRRFMVVLLLSSP
jgi:hypothetical protein